MTLCGDNECCRGSIVVTEHTVVAHHRIEVVDSLAVFGDVAVVDASAESIVPLGVGEERQVARGGIRRGIASSVVGAVDFQVGHVGNNIIVGVETERCEVITCACCTSSEVAEVGIVTILIQRDTCSCKLITCAENSLPASRLIGIESYFNLCGGFRIVRQGVRILTSCTGAFDVLQRSVLVRIYPSEVVLLGIVGKLYFNVVKGEIKLRIMSSIIDKTKLDS